MAMKQVGWEKVWDIYSFRKFKKGAQKPAVLLFISVVAFFMRGDVSEMELISILTNIVVSGFPSILGFVLTGYALIVGFSGSEFLLRMAKKQLRNGHTLYENVNATFAVVIGILTVTYILSVTVTFVQGLKIVWPFENGVHIFNIGVLFILLFFLYYSLCSLFDIVVNVFNLGQFANIVASNKLRLIEEMSKQEEERNHDNGGTKCSFITKVLYCLMTLFDDDKNASSSAGE